MNFKQAIFGCSSSSSPLQKLNVSVQIFLFSVGIIGSITGITIALHDGYVLRSHINDTLKEANINPPAIFIYLENGKENFAKPSNSIDKLREEIVPHYYRCDNSFDCIVYPLQSGDYDKQISHALELLNPRPGTDGKVPVVELGTNELNVVTFTKERWGDNSYIEEPWKWALLHQLWFLPFLLWRCATGWINWIFKKE